MLNHGDVVNDHDVIVFNIDTNFAVLLESTVASTAFSFAMPIFQSCFNFFYPGIFADESREEIFSGIACSLLLTATVPPCLVFVAQQQLAFIIHSFL